MKDKNTFEIINKDLNLWTQILQEPSLFKYFKLDENTKKDLDNNNFNNYTNRFLFDTYKQPSFLRYANAYNTLNNFKTLKGWLKDDKEIKQKQKIALDKIKEVLYKNDEIKDYVLNKYQLYNDLDQVYFYLKEQINIYSSTLKYLHIASLFLENVFNNLLKECDALIDELAHELKKDKITSYVNHLLTELIIHFKVFDIFNTSDFYTIHNKKMFRYKEAILATDIKEFALNDDKNTNLVLNYGIIPRFSYVSNEGLTMIINTLYKQIKKQNEQDEEDEDTICVNCVNGICDTHNKKNNNLNPLVFTSSLNKFLNLMNFIKKQKNFLFDTPFYLRDLSNTDFYKTKKLIYNLSNLKNLKIYSVLNEDGLMFLKQFIKENILIAKYKLETQRIIYLQDYKNNEPYIKIATQGVANKSTKIRR